jgi:hypothetical protein
MSVKDEPSRLPAQKIARVGDDDDNADEEQIDLNQMRQARVERFEAGGVQPDEARYRARQLREQYARDEEGDLQERVEALRSISSEQLVTNTDQLVAEIFQEFFARAVEVFAWHKAEAEANGDNEYAAYLNDLERRVKLDLARINGPLEKMIDGVSLTPTDALMIEPRLLNNTSRIVHAIDDYRKLAVDERLDYLEYLFGDDGMQRIVGSLDQSRTSARCRFLNESACRGVGSPCDWFADPGAKTGQCKERAGGEIRNEPSMQAQELLNSLVSAQQPMCRYLNRKTDQAIRNVLLSSAASFNRVKQTAARAADSSLVRASNSLVVRPLKNAVTSITRGAAINVGLQAASLLFDMCLPDSPLLGWCLASAGRGIPWIAGTYAVYDLCRNINNASNNSASSTASGNEQYKIPLSNAKTRVLSKKITQEIEQSRSNRPRQSQQVSSTPSLAGRKREFD